MNKYQFGIIYKLVSKYTNDIYIGSTVNGYGRFVVHKNCYKNRKGNKHITSKNLSAFKILKYEDCEMKLIENYPCNSKRELEERETHWILNNQNCINDRELEERETECILNNENCINDRPAIDLTVDIKTCKTKEDLKLRRNKIAKNKQRENRLDPEYKKIENEKKKEWRKTEKGIEEYKRKQEKREWVSFYKTQFVSLDWFKSICINSLHIYPLTKEEKLKRKKRHQRIWYHQNKQKVIDKVNNRRKHLQNKNIT